MGSRFGMALGCSALVCAVCAAGSISASAAGGRCRQPPRSSAVTRKTVSAIQCVVGQARVLREDVLSQARNAYVSCKDEESNPTPRWKVVEEDGNSMIEFARTSLPEVAAEYTGIDAYLGRFTHAYHGHESFLLQHATVEFRKAKDYTDAFAEEIVKAGEHLKQHDCARELNQADGTAKTRDGDARGAEAQATGALSELAG
jgi:hypothetical protein